MKLIKLLTTLVLLFSLNLIHQSATAKDKLLMILEQEIKREFDVLKTQSVPVYHISYRVEESYGEYVTSSLGSYTGSSFDSNNKPRRQLTVELRVGTPEIDNTRELKKDRMSFNTYVGNVALPYEDDADAIKQLIWKETDKQYQKAVLNYSRVLADQAVTVDSEDKSPDFSTLNDAEQFFEPALDYSKVYLDKNEWTKRLNEYSSEFLTDPSIIANWCNISFSINRKYFVSSSGASIAQNNESTRVFIYGLTKADDGMELPLIESFFAFSPNGLPGHDEMLDKVKKQVKTLGELKVAPTADPFTGPALLSGASAGVFFHEIFGHRIEGHRLKNESDAQTFKKKVGELVLPESFSVYFDPQLKQYKGFDLNGYYQFDDEGVRGNKVSIVENGNLKGFLMSRKPIDNFPRSNGHGRAQNGMTCVSRQSNMIVESNDHLTYDELRVAFIDEIKAQGKEYGYYFKDVMGGFTQTGRFMPNAFNVFPILVYRVYVDGKPDELVRGVDLIGTPLSMFAQISKAGGDFELFTGNCGAESGSVPVSSVSPSLLVNTIETQKNMKSLGKPFVLSRPDEGATR